VLVGDHCQLPPTVSCLEAEKRGLSLSLFSRLIAQGMNPFFLDTQFRMHPEIVRFSAREFYHGKLQSGVKEHERVPPAGYDWPVERSGMAFVMCKGPEQREGESRTNLMEEEIVLDILAQVLAAKELSVLDIGIVSPYSAQVRSLRQRLRQDLPKRLKGSGVDLSGGLRGRRAANALEIASVDAFQGREKELIIFSAVRSNQYGRVGFLGDWRRLNVMVTRARRGLIVIGDGCTLRGDSTWARWLDCAEESGYAPTGTGREEAQSSEWYQELSQSTKKGAGVADGSMPRGSISAKVSIADKVPVARGSLGKVQQAAKGSVLTAQTAKASAAPPSASKPTLPNPKQKVKVVIAAPKPSFPSY